jgi:hypothetical protein
MHPRYITLSSSGSSLWQEPNWQATPQQISFAILSTGGSSWSVDITFEDPSGVNPSPRSSAPTAFTVLTGSSNQFVTLGTSAVPITGYRFNFNVPSSAGATATLVVNQAGVG